MAGKKGVKNSKKKVKEEVVKEEIIEEVVEEVVEEEEAVEEKAEEEVVDEVVDENTFESLKSSLNDVLTKVSTLDDIPLKELLKFKKDLMNQVKSLVNQTKKLEKMIGKNKTVEKKKRKVTTSGFDKQVGLIKDAQLFITKNCNGKLEEGENLSRREVNKYIHSYIKDNNLQNPKNRRDILPDKALQSILSILSKDKNKNGTVDADVGYNYFNLQRYIKHIFIKLE